MTSLEDLDVFKLAHQLASRNMQRANSTSREIPGAQLTAAKPSLERIFAKNGKKAIAEAYEQGYRLNEIAAHLGVHYATVSRRLKQIAPAS